MSDDALIRRESLRAVMKARALTIEDLQAVVGGRYTYWRDLLNDEKKSFGEKAARKIEEKLGLQRGYLDRGSVADEFDSDTLKFAAMYQRLSPAERHKLRLLYNVARDGHQTSIPKAPGRQDTSSPRDTFLGDGESGLGGLDEIPAPPKGGKRGSK